MVIFFDKKQRARAHLQCVPKRHIKDWTHLRPSDAALLSHMHEVGKAYLEANFPPHAEGLRFGFHSPGQNSQYHLHMHCLALPLHRERDEKRFGAGGGLVKYDYVLGKLLKSTSST